MSGCVCDVDKPMPVPGVISETEEEKYLFKTAPERAIARKTHRTQTKDLIDNLTSFRKKSPTSKREGATAPVKVGDEFRLA